jgi:hypothetical protein
MKQVLVSVLAALFLLANVGAQVTDPSCYKCCGWGNELEGDPGHRACTEGNAACHVTACPDTEAHPLCCTQTDGYNDYCAYHPDEWNCDSFYFHYCFE